MTIGMTPLKHRDVSTPRFEQFLLVALPAEARLQTELRRVNRQHNQSDPLLTLVPPDYPQITQSPPPRVHLKGPHYVREAYAALCVCVNSCRSVKDDLTDIPFDQGAFLGPHLHSAEG